MSNNMEVKDIDRKFFWELVDDDFCLYKGTDVVETYLYMICQKLKKDTGISFRNEAYWSITNKDLNITILSKDIKDYDSLLAIIESKLGSGSDREDAKLLNDMGGVIDYSPYYENDKGTWHTYDQYMTSNIFEIWYYGLYGKYHSDLGFAHDIAKKYLVEVDWKSPKVYNGEIEELDGMKVRFSKNGNIRISSKMPDSFWQNIAHLYSVADPKGHRHHKNITW